jgi:hypothetical protein
MLSLHAAWTMKDPSTISEVSQHLRRREISPVEITKGVPSHGLRPGRADGPVESAGIVLVLGDARDILRAISPARAAYRK